MFIIMIVICYVCFVLVCLLYGQSEGGAESDRRKSRRIESAAPGPGGQRDYPFGWANTYATEALVQSETARTTATATCK